jgi:hypothetical protein
MEMADTLGVPLNWVWNNVMRGTSPEPEPPELHTRASNRRFFNVSVVLAWLSEREGHIIEPWQWCRTWLAARSLIGPDATAGEVLTAIRAIDRARVYRRRWRVQKELYDARLAEVLGTLKRKKDPGQGTNAVVQS